MASFTALALPKKPFKPVTAFSVVVPRAQLKEPIQLKKKLWNWPAQLRGQDRLTHLP